MVYQTAPLSGKHQKIGTQNGHRNVLCSAVVHFLNSWVNFSNWEISHNTKISELCYFYIDVGFLLFTFGFVGLGIKPGALHMQDTELRPQPSDLFLKH